jgi:hypothetical protein
MKLAAKNKPAYRVPPMVLRTMSTWHDLAKLREEIALANTTRADFYVYVLFRETGEPFYVGKGANGRWLKHEFDARNGAKGHRFSIIRKLQARGLDVPKVKLHEGLTEQVAHAYEIALIAAIGRRHEGGPLANETAGGEGASDPSPETREKIGARTRGKRHSPEHAAKLAAMLRLRNASPEHVAKVSAANQGKKHSPETRARLSATHLGQKRSPESVAKTAAALRGREKSLEHRAKIAAANRGRNLELSAANRGRKNSPETIAKMRESARRRGISSETLTKMAIGRRGRKRSPEAIAKAAASLRGRKRSAEVNAKAWATRRAKAYQTGDGA